MRITAEAQDRIWRPDRQLFDAGVIKGSITGAKDGSVSFRIKSFIKLQLDAEYQLTVSIDAKEMKALINASERGFLKARISSLETQLRWAIERESALAKRNAAVN